MHRKQNCQAKRRPLACKNNKMVEMKLDKDTFKNYMEGLKRYLIENNINVFKIVIYGSIPKRTYHANSDVDVLIVVNSFKQIKRAYRLASKWYAKNYWDIKKWCPFSWDFIVITKRLWLCRRKYCLWYWVRKEPHWEF